jgi:hypothetical protein
MLKKTITYTDFNGVPQVEDFYFNLNEAELAEKNLSTKGGLVKHLQEIAASEDGATIVNKFKEIILWSYGIKSDDGKRFIKNDEVREAFTQTNAYSVLFMELATNTDKASEFINGLVPSNLSDQEGRPGVPQDYKQKEIPTANTTVVVDPEADAAAKMNMSVDEYREYTAWQARKNDTTTS